MRKWAAVPDRCIDCSIDAAVTYDLAVSDPTTVEHAQAVSNGKRGGRPRKTSTFDLDQLPLF